MYLLTWFIIASISRQKSAASCNIDLMVHCSGKQFRWAVQQSDVAAPGGGEEAGARAARLRTAGKRARPGGADKGAVQVLPGTARHQPAAQQRGDDGGGHAQSRIQQIEMNTDVK